MDTFTEAQLEAAQKMSDIAKEHFDCCVIVVAALGDTNKDNDVTSVYWSGGYLSCLGAIEAGRTRLMAKEIARAIKRENEE